MSPREHRLLRLIRNVAAANPGVAPSLADLIARFGARDGTAVRGLMDRLEARGLLPEEFVTAVISRPADGEPPSGSGGGGDGPPEDPE